MVAKDPVTREITSMSTSTLMDQLSAYNREGQITKLLPALACFARISVGLTMLNSGLMGIFAKSGRGSPFGNSGFGTPVTAPGMEGLIMALPYLELALAVGLIFGIFTTIVAFLSCLLSLLTPLLTTYMLVSGSANGQGMNQFAMGLNPFSMLFPNQGMLAYVLVVILSPLSINRYSVDALIFRQGPGPFPRRGMDSEAPKEINTP